MGASGLAAAGGGLTPQGLSCVLWSLVQLRGRREVPLSKATRQELLGAVMQLLGEFNSQSLAMAVWALAWLKVRCGTDGGAGSVL
jgi:hypothetical protein